MSQHVVEALPTPVGHVVSLCDILGGCSFPENIKPLEDALIGEV